jgi:hypothetical protein
MNALKSYFQLALQFDTLVLLESARVLTMLLRFIANLNGARLSDSGNE